MARGKYKARKQSRDASQLATDLARVRAELTQEEDKLTQARERAAADALLRQELAHATAARDLACAPVIEQITHDCEALQAARRELADANSSLGRHVQKSNEWLIRELGLETFSSILTGDRSYIRQGVDSDHLSAAAVTAIQRARGLRQREMVDFTAEQRRAISELAAASTGLTLPLGVTGDGDEQVWDTFSDMVGQDAAAATAFSWPLPWVDTTAAPEHPASAILGANGHDDRHSTVEPVREVPALAELGAGTAALRDATVEAGARTVIGAFTDTLQRGLALASRSQFGSPFTAGSVYPGPADAAVLHGMYAAAAAGEWGRHRTVTNGRAAVAAAAAVPFWLPPGHTIAYLDSEPLALDDIDEIRMPYAQTFINFAEPAQLPPLAAADLTSDPRLAEMDHTVAVSAKEARPNPRTLMLAGTDTLKKPLPGLWELIAARGARIEGVLLLADAHGRLDDQFAWCVAIPSTAAGGVLGRWVIPALRSKTHYGDLVANAAAVVAWADWHRPGQPRGAADETADDGRSRAASRAADLVRVLNVAVTTPKPAADGASAAPTGRTTAPHRRRGHWRRQHYGPARSQTKRIRIAPVLVNAGRRGSGRPQVYRLPAPGAL